MHVAHLTLHDFRSYASLDLPLTAGATAFVGRNGQGKTNLVEAIDYLCRLSSHRVAGEAPLIRAGAERAVVRASVVKDERTAVLEVELIAGKANKARINRAPLTRPRDLLGLVRTVVFAPDDLSLVKGDPSERRGFLDDLLMLRAPRLAGVKADYDRVLKQRNALLKSAGGRGRSNVDAVLGSLEAWDEHLVALGAEVLMQRLNLVEQLGPYLGAAYESVARGVARDAATAEYKPSVELEGARDQQQIADILKFTLAVRQRDELDRGLTLVGPHRDDLVLSLGDANLRLPVKGYASHGESWSFALALRLASYDLLRDDGDDPILVLDDVFAELDTGRREQLAGLVAGAEQVLVTAAVADDVPAELAGTRFVVSEGQVTRG